MTIETLDKSADIPGPAMRGGTGWIAAGGVVGALIASSCCIVPLALVLAGISGAWIANLTALEPYRYYLMATASLVIAAGFWHVYFRPKADCAEDSYCARPSSSFLTQAALWLAALLILLDATLAWWAPLFY